MCVTLVSRFNDFEKLEEVVVGRCSDACELTRENAMDPWQNRDVIRKSQLGSKMPTEMIKMANYEMDGLCSVLEGEGICVRRPDEQLCNFSRPIKTPDWEMPL